MQLCAPLFCFLSLLLPHTYTRTFFVFPPSPFIFALFPDCLGTRQVVARFGVLLTRGNLAAVSLFPTPVRSDPFTGWVPPNRLGVPSPFSVPCWVDTMRRFGVFSRFFLGFSDFWRILRVFLTLKIRRTTRILKTFTFFRDFWVFGVFLGFYKVRGFWRKIRNSGNP